MEPADGKLLLELARKTIESRFSHQKFDTSPYRKFDEDRGVFVTLHKDGELRGCIGFPIPVYRLKEAVMKAALSAAFEDPRFSPLREEELKDVKFEVTVLTAPEEIKYDDNSELPGQIDVGKDGLIVEHNGTSGLLLPQVFTEYKCDGEKALEMTCQKAGLPARTWKEKGFVVKKFQGEIFSEKNIKKVS